MSWSKITIPIAALPACLMSAPQPRVDATWTISSFVDGINDREVGCPDGWVAMRLVTAEAEHLDVQTVDRFRCADGRGASSRLPQGSYVSWLEVVDADDKVVATSLPSPVEIEPLLETRYDTKIYVDAGYAAMSWSIVPVRCEDSDKTSPFGWIYLRLTGPTTENAIFTCDAKRGVSGPALPGTYSVWVGQGVSGHSEPDIVIEAPNHVTELPPEQFD